MLPLTVQIGALVLYWIRSQDWISFRSDSLVPPHLCTRRYFHLERFFIFLLANFCLQTFSELFFKWKNWMEKEVLITIENNKFSSNLTGFVYSTWVSCRNSSNRQSKQSLALLYLAYLNKYQAFSLLSTYISCVLSLYHRVYYSMSQLALFPTP